VVKAISANARIIVMDEPTAAFPPNEVELLFESIRALCKQGISIIYISHRLDEIFQIVQRVTVLRDGKLVGTRRLEEVTHGDLVHMMVGHTIEHDDGESNISTNHTDNQSVLQVAALTQAGSFENINLQTGTRRKSSEFLVCWEPVTMHLSKLSLERRDPIAGRLSLMGRFFP